MNTSPVKLSTWWMNVSPRFLPFADAATLELPLPRLLRLALFQVSVGMAIVLLNGTLNLHGDRENSWTKLARTAQAGSREIEVLDARGWRTGDEIVLASTDFNPRQAERRRITAVGD